MIKKLFWMWVCVTACELIILAVNILRTGFGLHVYASCAGLLICIYGWNKWFQMRDAEAERAAAFIAMEEEMEKIAEELFRQVEAGELVIPPNGLEFDFRKIRSELSKTDKP